LLEVGSPDPLRCGTADFMQELNLSQAKFAKAISISNEFIADIEIENRKDFYHSHTVDSF